MIQAQSTSDFVEEGEAPGLAGDIEVFAHDALHSNNSSVTAASVPGDGGNLRITGRALEFLDSSVSAEVGGRPDTIGGNIDVSAPDFVILDNGAQIIANAFEGQGGNIDVKTKALLVSPDSLISASSELGVDGVVQVNAPESDLTTNLESLSAQFLDTSQLRNQCAELEQSNFRIAGRGVGSGPDEMLAGLSASEVVVGGAAGCP